MPQPLISPDDVITLLLQEQIIESPEPLTSETDLFACGLDSMALMQLLLHVEQRFQVQVPAAEMKRESFATAAKLADFLSSQCRAAA